MSKMTTLQIFNAILRNCGEKSDLTDLASLSGFQNVVWDKLLEALVEICVDQDTQWQFLESDGEVPLVNGSYRYLISGLAKGADMQREDRASFKQTDSGNKVKFCTPQEWDALFPGGIQTSMAGFPTRYLKYGGYIYFDKYATVSEDSKIVNFRYWKHPTYPSQSSPSGTLDIPEPFDRLLLIPLASLKALAHLGNDGAALYKMQVFGDGGEVEGSLAMMKEIYGSPDLITRVSLNA